jgi:hypothetical protein
MAAALVLIGIASCRSTSSKGETAKINLGLPVSDRLTLTDVRTRLQSAGLEPKAGGQVEQSFLSVPGTLLHFPEAELQIYIYPDPIFRAGDTATLDPLKVAPPTMRVTWMMPASLVTVGNVAVIVLTRDEALRARIRTALTGL